jgi:hypothetical protein
VGEFAPELVPWESWTPAEAAARLAGVEAPWCVAAGWAIDLFLGGLPREHEDLEIAVPAGQASEIFAALAPLEPYVAQSGRALPLAEADEFLQAGVHQTWMLERAEPCWRLDVFREPFDGGGWVCRRDETIRMGYDELIRRTDDGIPYLRPDVTLLFKAKHARSKDEGDFAAALPRLDHEERRWLRDALELVHPGHRWLGELG